MLFAAVEGRLSGYQVFVGKAELKACNWSLVSRPTRPKVLHGARHPGSSDHR